MWVWFFFDRWLGKKGLNYGWYLMWICNDCCKKKYNNVGCGYSVVCMYVVRFVDEFGRMMILVIVDV